MSGGRTRTGALPAVRGVRLGQISGLTALLGTRAPASSLRGASASVATSAGSHTYSGATHREAEGRTGDGGRFGKASPKRSSGKRRREACDSRVRS